LTAGTTLDQHNGNELPLCPYAPILELALRQQHRRRNNNSKEDAHDVLVRHRGLPGWTSQQMVDDLDGPNTGLRTAIVNAKNQTAAVVASSSALPTQQQQQPPPPPLSIVILLAGTNDIGYGLLDSEEIFENLWTLHQTCLDLGVPKTIAVGIPPSGYQAVNKVARRTAQDVNRMLEEQCRSTRTSTFVGFPFAYEPNGAHWSSDGLHFSQLGYKVLGEECLAPVVKRILDELL